MGILDLFRKWQDIQSGKYRARRRKGLVRTELLEVRRVLSPVVVSGSTLNVNAATNAPISITNSGTAVSIGVDGGTYNYASGISTINLVGSTGNDHITLSGSFSSIIVNINGGGGNDTLIGPNLATTWTLSSGNAGSLLGGQVSFSAIQNLQGGTASNTFNFAGGFVSGNLVGGSGGNAISYAAANTGVLVNLATGQATAVGGTISNITNFVGCTSLHDLLIGANTANTWNILGNDSGNINGTIGFSFFDNLQGGSANDRFVFSGGVIQGSINGGYGTNTFDYSNLSGTTVTVDMGQGLATYGGGINTGFTNITNFIGAPTSNSSSLLIGPNITDSWNITGPNTGNINGSYTFTSFNNIQGGRGANSFGFLGGFIGGNLTGGVLTNTLDYSLSASGLLINLSAGQTTAVGGTVSNITGVVGNGGGLLIGLNGANLWTISGANAGQFVNQAPTVVPKTTTVTFSNIANLTGGVGMNTFDMLTGGSLSGTLNGGTPVNNTIAPDWLDYSTMTTAVTVNLNTGVATNIGKVLNILGVHGSNGVSTLTGSSNGSVLVGGAANDVLTAGSGRSLLIGGLGADTITGGAGQNILIAGYTNYDENFSALSAILAEWQSSNSFATRISNIRNGGGLNGTNVLVANTTVHNDKAANSLYDGTGSPNWLWGQPSELKKYTSSDQIDTPILVPPILSSPAQTIFTVGNGAVAVNGGVQLTDSQSTTLRSATIQLAANYNSAQDVLSFTSSTLTGNITGSFNSTTGVMTLTSANGLATVAQFQLALQEVLYTNTSSTPTTATRTTVIQVNDGLSTSNALVGTMSINFAPVLAGTSTASFTPGTSGVVINPTITVSDANDVRLSYATVTISHNLQIGEDVLAFVGNASTGQLFGTYNAFTGVLTITSTGAPGTLAQYQAALQLVTYQDTNSTTPFLLPRTIAFQVYDGAALSNTIQSTVTIA